MEQDQQLMSAVLADAGFLAFTGRMYPVERCVIVTRDADEILALCADLISHTIEEDRGNLLVFLPGMNEILRVDKLVEEKL